MLVWGAFQGALDVAMNAHGTEVELAHGGAIMSAFHGYWSIGALLGALIGASAVGLGITLDTQLLVLGVVTLLITSLVSTRLLAPSEAGDQPNLQRTGRRRGPPKVALLLGAVAFASMLCEGATADWSAVHLRTDLASSAGVAGFAYVGYSCAMVVVRMLAARIFEKAAPARIIPVFALIASIGMTIGLLSRSITVTIIGFAALGIGLATVVPTAFTAASRIPEGNPGSNIALVSALGWAGFVCGPPLIGHLSELTGLPVALGVVPLFALAITIMVWTLHLFPSEPVRRSPDEDAHGVQPAADPGVGSEAR